MFTKLKDAFTSLPRDKVLHFGVGIAVLVTTIFLVWVAGLVGSVLAGVLAATMLGFAYEGVQKFRKEGTVEMMDALAVSAGSVAGAVILYLLLFIFNSF